MRKARLISVLVALLAAGLLALAPRAGAWSGGNVWVSFGPWNCTGGGSVVGIAWAVDGFSVGPAGGDWGDNTIYPRVRVGSGAHNVLSYTVWCKKWGIHTYKSLDGQRVLTPYKSGLRYTL